MESRCFACGRAIKDTALTEWCDTRGGREAPVGPDCYRKIVAAGEAGYKPTKGRPRLWPAQSYAEESK